MEKECFDVGEADAKRFGTRSANSPNMKLSHPVIICDN